MKVLMCVLAVFVASCNAGFLFAASGFYGGIDKGLKSFVVDDVAEKVIIPKPVLGVSKVTKTFPKVYADFYATTGHTAVPGGVVIPKPLFGVSKVIKTFPKVYADFGDISGRAIAPEEVFVSKQVFGVPKLIKTIPKVYADPYIFYGRRVFRDQFEKETEVVPDTKESATESDRGGLAAHGSGGVDVQQEGETIKLILTEDDSGLIDGGNHAHQDIKYIKVIRVANEHGENVRHGGHGEEGGQQEINANYVINEDKGNSGLSGLGASAGPFAQDYSSQYGVFGGQKVVKTIKVIQDYSPFHGRHNEPNVGFGNDGFDQYSGSDRSQKIRTIKVSYAGDGSAGPLTYGGQNGYFDNKD